MLPELDPLLHSDLRLKIISILMGVVSAEFTHIMDTTGATRGNISVQLKKLEDAGYISIKKTFGKSYPVTTCKITENGRSAFESYVEAISKYINCND